MLSKAISWFYLFAAVQAMSLPYHMEDWQHYMSPEHEKEIADAPIRKSNLLSVRHELEKAEIIPTVIDAFLPSLLVNISWSNKHYSDLGNTIKPTKLQDAPDITLLDEPTSTSASTSGDGDVSCRTSNMTYVLALTDPDAPSRDDPKWSEMCHWIATGVSVSAHDRSASSSSTSPQSCAYTLSSIKDVMPYKAPGPPPKTGKHRYVFLVFAPQNGTSIPLNVSKPEERKHWGFGKADKGVREWAEENQLVPVAANFIYAKNKKQ